LYYMANYISLGGPERVYLQVPVGLTTRRVQFCKKSLLNNYKLFAMTRYFMANRAKHLRIALLLINFEGTLNSDALN